MTHTKSSFGLAAAMLVLSAGMSLAGPACTTQAQAKWMSEQAMKAQILAAGYKIKVFKITGSCYEIYGWNKDGKKAEVYFNPVDGNIVR